MQKDIRPSDFIKEISKKLFFKKIKHFLKLILKK